MKEILELEGNTKGNDLIIGDVHGNAVALKKVLDELQPNDRLFITGDLIDRGTDSYKVCELIWKHNENKQIFAVRGNHEKDFLNFMCHFKNIPELQQFNKNLSAFTNQTLNKAPQVSICDKNYTAHNLQQYYMLKSQQFLYNSASGKSQNTKFKILITDLLAKSQKCHAKTTENFLLSNLNFTLCTLNGGKKWLTENMTASPKNLFAMANYFTKLPYAIYVKGKSPYAIVHSFIPFNLNLRIQNPAPLTEEEKFDMLVSKNNNHFPNQNDFPIYRGHTPFAGVINPKEICLDVRTWSTDIFIRFNHTQNTCELIGENTLITREQMQLNQTSIPPAADDKNEQAELLNDPNNIHSTFSAIQKWAKDRVKDRVLVNYSASENTNTFFNKKYDATCSQDNDDLSAIYVSPLKT